MIKKQKILQSLNKIKKINAKNPRPDLINEALSIIKKGGIISFPTRCFYGLGVDALNPEAIDKVFAVKQRPYNKPILIFVENRDELDKIVDNVPPCALRIMDKFWPGGITIVFEAKETLPVNLTAKTGKIGVRLPMHQVAHALVRGMKGPITGTSANISGNPGCLLGIDLDSRIADKLDLILDAGPLKGGAGSTVIDVTTGFPTILREGEVPAADIFEVVG